MNLKRKLNSRKLWASIIGVITGIAMIFGVDEGIASAIAGAMAVVISVVVYIITEGKVDAESIQLAIEAARESEKPEESGGGGDD